MPSGQETSEELEGLRQQLIADGHVELLHSIDAARSALIAFAMVVTNGDLPIAKKLFTAVLEAELAGRDGVALELIETELRRAWTEPRRRRK